MTPHSFPTSTSPSTNNFLPSRNSPSPTGKILHNFPANFLIATFPILDFALGGSGRGEARIHPPFPLSRPPRPSQFEQKCFLLISVSAYRVFIVLLSFNSVIISRCSTTTQRVNRPPFIEFATSHLILWMSKNYRTFIIRWRILVSSSCSSLMFSSWHLTRQR